MLLPVVLFVISGLGCLVALMLPGWVDLLLLAGPCALASLYLLIRAGLAARVPDAKGDAPAMRGFRLRRRGAERYVLVDGSNVLHWRDNKPDLDTLRAVIAAVAARGLVPAVVFDANAGYLVAGKYLHDKALGDLLALPEDRVMVVQKGAPADPVLLTAARDLGARIVTNDRYRDWATDFPQVREPGFLVRGGWRNGALWLDLDDMAMA